MSSTNRTTNYQLPQFLSTDKPTWLGDVNGAMSIIDSQMKSNADAASAAGTAAANAATSAALAETNGRVSTLEASVSQISSDLQKIRVYNGLYSTPTYAGNTTQSITPTLPSNYKDILAVIPVGYTPSNDWATLLQFIEVTNNNEILVRTIGTSNQHYGVHYFVIYTVN